MDGVQDEEGFLRRRAGEEELKATQSSCLVRSAHEDMAELYEERADALAAETAELRRLLDRLA